MRGQKKGSFLRTGSKPYEMGEFTQILASGRIKNDFCIRYVDFTSPSDISIYRLKLFSGEIGQEVLIGEFMINSENCIIDKNISIEAIIPVQKANSRISARLASQNVKGSMNISLRIRLFS